MTEVSVTEQLRLDEIAKNPSVIIKKDYEARGGVMRGFEKDEPSISEFSDTPKNSEDGGNKKNRRFKRILNASDDSMDHLLDADSPSKALKGATSPDKAG
jgi:hypothetical protein